MSFLRRSYKEVWGWENQLNAQLEDAMVEYSLNTITYAQMGIGRGREYVIPVKQPLGQ